MNNCLVLVVSESVVWLPRCVLKQDTKPLDMILFVQDFSVSNCLFLSHSLIIYIVYPVRLTEVLELIPAGHVTISGLQQRYTELTYSNSVVDYRRNVAGGPTYRQISV